MKTRRGVSEIVATLIILITVTILGVVLYNFALSTTNSQTNSLLSSTYVQEKTAMERLEVISIVCVGGETHIDLINYGKTEVTISAIYVNDRLIMNNYSVKKWNPDAMNWQPVSSSNILDLNRMYISSLSLTRGDRVLLVSSRGDSIAITY